MTGWEPANGYDHRSFQWSAGTAGTYQVEVDVREQGETVPYDAVANGTYKVVGCSSAQISASLASPQLPGTAIRITGSGTCPTDYPEFRFWVRDLSGRWAIAQDYAGYVNQPYFYFDWNTAGAAQGTYGLEVDVRDAGAAAPYEAVANMTFQLGTPNCSTPTLTPNPGTGPIVVFTAGTSGCITPPVYRFWISPPSGGWHIVQDYSPTNTYSWNTSGLSGTYRIEVDVRNTGSSLPYVAVKGITYTIGRCTAAELTADKTSPQAPGATIVLTAGASCTGTPEYEFLIDVNGVQTALQQYGSVNTYSWNTTGLPGGTYVLEVWVRNLGSPVAYDTSADTWFALVIPTCQLAQLTTDKPSPQAAGTTIALTGSAAACPTGAPEFRFLLTDPNNQVTVLQDWSSNSTYSWNTTGLAPGTYQLTVEARTQGSTGGSETGMQIAFVLT